MKKTSSIIIALLLAVTIAMSLPVQVFADSTTEKYISEIKIGVDKKADKALAALEGYEILKGDDGKPVDLNKDAGGGVGSKGNRVVYLGFKRTSDRSEAVTDLAVMNMKGGYSTEDYDALMDYYIKEQITPFVDSFLAAIEEYRANYNSSNSANRQRAQYAHDALNKLTDDDCGGAGLGDLLLNETKYEMGDTAYNALSAEQKKQHADILTIVAQANGRATLLMESLLLKAADTEDTTWLERFAEITYQDLEDETGLSPSKAKAALDKLYYDDAAKFLEMWDAFKEHLDGYDDAVAKLEELNDTDIDALKAIIESYDILTATEEQSEAYANAIAKVSTYSEVYFNAYNDVLCKEYLETVEYDLSDFDLDGETLLDLFTLDRETVEKNIECLYPLIASLSPGQKAGIALITLQDLVILGIVDSEAYKKSEYDDLTPSSVYEGVDRGIYEPGGVGLTSDAQRTDALIRMAEQTDGFKLGALTFIGISAVGAAAIGLGVSLGLRQVANNAISSYHSTLTPLKEALAATRESRETAAKIITDSNLGWAERGKAVRTWDEAGRLIESQEVAVKRAENPQLLNRLESRSATCSKLAIGFGVAIVIITAITIWLTFKDLKDYYKVDFTPAPKYMVDEKDITAYNARGEKIVIKNQAAYYKAAQFDRASDAEYFNVLGHVADLNGDVGRQWLALYVEKNENNDPILADSFKASSGEHIPAGYEFGIHMFGSAAVENLNNPLYVWKSDAPKVFIYYKLEANTASTTGTNFTGGIVAVSGGTGFAIGALAMALGSVVAKKKKEKEST